MKNTEKLMILISVVLVSLLAIGAVSAADADTTVIRDDAGAEDIEPEAVPIAEPDPIEKPEVTEPAGTFQKLDDEIVAGQINHKGNVTLDKDYKNTDGHGNILIKQQTDENGVIYDKVNLDGKDHIIDGNYNKTIFTIDSDMTVIMKNLMFINGNGKNAGAILNKGNLTLINVTFMDNWGTNYGGAITNVGMIEIINATFIRNGAGSETTEFGYGGAIANDAGKDEFLKITNATFIDNSAILGGAIYNSGMGLALSNVGFFDNFADNGGAIYNDEEFFAVMDTVVFDGNGASENGGAIFTEGDFIEVINHAWFYNNFAEIYGGAIYTLADEFALNDTYFFNNTVYAPSSSLFEPAGGAIFGFNQLVLAIANSTFALNTATNELGKVGSGGAISAYDVYIEDSGFYSNVAALEGGAIETALIKVVNTTFENNAAKYGGAIFIADSDVEEPSTIEDAYFEDNEAEENGGAIFSYNRFSVIESEFEGNVAIQGGAIYSDDYLYMESSNFTENGLDADYSYGGAIYISDNGKLYATGSAKKPNNFINDVAAYGSEIYNANPGEEPGEEPGEKVAYVEYALVANIDGEGSFVSVDTKYTRFYTVTSLDFEVVNNETGSVGIIVYLINANKLNDDVEDDYLIYGEKVNISIMDEDGNFVVEDDEYIIGGIYRPEVEGLLLANGTYTIFIEYNGNKKLLYYASEMLVDDFEVVNMTAVLEDVYEKGNATGYADGYIKGNATGYADGYIKGNATGYINGYNTAESIANDTIENLNNTNKNLTAENTKLKGDLANKTTEATNLQNQVNTLNSQLTSAQTANTETNAKIKTVSAKSKVKKSKNFKITVTLSSTKVNGKYVYVIFNGKSYKAKTKNGVAKITIKKSALKKLGGKKIKYQIVYNQSLKNKTVKIKK